MSMLINPYRFGVSAPVGTYDAEVLADSPIAYWKLDETSGTTAADEQAAHDGAYAGTYTLGGTAVVSDGGSSFDIAGSGRMVVPHHADFNMAATGVSDETIEMWVKLDNPAASAIQFLADKTAGASANGQWDIAWDNRSGVQTLRCWAAGSSYIVTWSGSAPQSALAAGGHLVFVKRGTTLELWWDGSLEASATYGAYTPSSSNTLDPTFGQYTGAGFGVTGLMDNIAFYKTALSSTRIGVHHTAGS